MQRGALKNLASHNSGVRHSTVNKKSGMVKPREKSLKNLARFFC